MSQDENITAYVLYDFTNAEIGSTFEEWNKTIEVCSACGRAGFDDSNACDDAFVHVMGREEEIKDACYCPRSMFMVFEYCNKTTAEWVLLDFAKTHLPNRKKHTKELEP